MIRFWDSNFTGAPPLLDSVVQRRRRAAVETSWWLDWGALPDRLIWARLQVAEDGSAVVLDMDGVYHRFPDRQAARFWLNEDEYSLLAHLAEDDEFGPGVCPPVAASDRELVPLMCVEQRHAEPAAAPDRRGTAAFS